MRKRSMIRRVMTLLMAAAMLFALASAAFAATASLDRAWTKDQEFTLADPAPWNLEELKQVVDVQDPRSVAAYWVWSVNRLIDDYDDGMEMMKYLFADIEPYGSGYYEGGMSGKAGWDTYFNERLKDADYKWLPRAYFEGGSARNGFTPTKPLTLELYYNDTNTETINKQTLEDFDVQIARFQDYFKQTSEWFINYTLLDFNRLISLKKDLLVQLADTDF